MQTQTKPEDKGVRDAFDPANISLLSQTLYNGLKF